MGMVIPFLEPGIFYSRATGSLVLAERVFVVLNSCNDIRSKVIWVVFEVSELNSNHIHAVIGSVRTSLECIRYCYTVGACRLVS